jgi:hypothetical protein
MEAEKEISLFLNEVRELKVDYPMDLVAWTVKNMVWESRSGEFPFYTIGKNSYQDSIGEYFAQFSSLNRQLWSKFENLYTEVLKVLTRNEGEQVYLDPRLSFPGFHIFPCTDPILKKVSGPWHVDVPHEKLCLGSEHAKAYTLAVEMPLGSGGLEFYDVDGDHEYVQYNVGSLYIHDGQLPHRIASLRKYRMGDHRITLQGHIIRHKGKLITFW